MPLLEVERASVTFGGLQALHDVSIQVEAGTLVGLIGPNGAGKTTLIDALTGFVRLSGGNLRLLGTDITSLRPDARTRLGLARTFQSLELFEDLTVAENLLAASERPSWWSLLANIAYPASDDEGRISDALEQVGLGGVGERLPDELPHGDRKLIGVARALAARPRLLLLDEPAAGLDPSESAGLGAHLCEVVDNGTAVLLVDHDMSLVLEVSDFVYVLDFGTLIAAGTPGQIRSDRRVLDAYLGTGAVEAQALTPGNGATS